MRETDLPALWLDGCHQSHPIIVVDHPSLISIRMPDHLINLIIFQRFPKIRHDMPKLFSRATPENQQSLIYKKGALVY